MGAMHTTKFIMVFMGHCPSLGGSVYGAHFMELRTEKLEVKLRANKEDLNREVQDLYYSGGGSFIQ